MVVVDVERRGAFARVVEARYLVRPVRWFHAEKVEGLVHRDGGLDVVSEVVVSAAHGYVDIGDRNRSGM